MKGGIDGSDLLASTGGLTAVGKVFTQKYTNLQHCGGDSFAEPVPRPTEKPVETPESEDSSSSTGPGFRVESGED